MTVSISTTPLIAPMGVTGNYPGTQPKVGELEIRFRRDEPLYLGRDVIGPDKGYASLEDALRGTAYVGPNRRHQYNAAFAVVRNDQGAYVAHELLQPEWEKGLLRERSRGLVPVVVQPTYGGDEPKFSFYKRRGYENDLERFGTISIDPKSGVEAVVGQDWALVGGRLINVDAQDPYERTRPTPKPPVDPAPAPAPGRDMLSSVTEGLRLSKEAARIIQSIPADDKGDASTKDARIKAFNTNMAAQKAIEAQFGATDDATVSTLRNADAALEDANWQLAKKPSPDGRFNGVDVPGALADTQRAVDLLEELRGQLVSAAA